jgi:holo-[acyl-carrier protein] synthase
VAEGEGAAIGRRLDAMAEGLITQRVGLDALHLPSWGRYLEVGGEPFLHRVYSEAELRDTEGNPERLAGRFAAKEAVLKVLGTGICAIGLGAVEVLGEESGRPRVKLGPSAGRIAESLSLSAFEVSICHEGDYALAMATARQSGAGQ